MYEGKREILVVGYEALGRITDIYNQDYLVGDYYHFTLCPIGAYMDSIKKQSGGRILDKEYDAILFDEVNLTDHLLTIPFIASRLNDFGVKYGFIVWTLSPFHPTLPEGSNTLHLSISSSEEIKEELDKWFNEVKREVILCTEHTSLTA